MASKATEQKTIKLKLIKGLAGVKKDQIATLESLGLRRIGDVTIQPANPATLGKAHKIIHMVETIED